MNVTYTGLMYTACYLIPRLIFITHEHIILTHLCTYMTVILQMSLTNRLFWLDSVILVIHDRPFKSCAIQICCGYENHLTCLSLDVLWPPVRPESLQQLHDAMVGILPLHAYLQVKKPTCLSHTGALHSWMGLYFSVSLSYQTSWICLVTRVCLCCQG